MKHQGDASLIVCIRSRAKSVRSEGDVLDEVHPRGAQQYDKLALGDPSCDAIP
jgi:hypothetical protein